MSDKYESKEKANIQKNIGFFGRHKPFFRPLNAILWRNNGFFISRQRVFFMSRRAFFAFKTARSEVFKVVFVNDIKVLLPKLVPLFFFNHVTVRLFFIIKVIETLLFHIIVEVGIVVRIIV